MKKIRKETDLYSCCLRHLEEKGELGQKKIFGIFLRHAEKCSSAMQDAEGAILQCRFSSPGHPLPIKAKQRVAEAE